MAALQIVPEPKHRREGQDFLATVLPDRVEEPRHVDRKVARLAVDAAPVPGRRQSLHGNSSQEAFATSISDRFRLPIFVSSRMVSLDPEIDYVAKVLARPANSRAAIRLIGRLKSGITYEIGATTVRSAPPMSFAAPRGVYQDFAH